MPTLECQLPNNRILAGLGSERDLILPWCEVVQIEMGDTVDEERLPIQFLHFPLTAAISVTAGQDHEHMVEVTLTGNEGSSGSSVVQGDNRSMCTAMVQIPGTAVRVPTSAVIDQLPRLPYLRAALARHNLLLMRHAVLSVACSQFHSPQLRLARWLKTHWHRTGIEAFPFSPEFLSVQVGVDSTTVTESLDDFQRQGLVKRSRNRVTITDHEALAKQCCQCYALAKEATDEYLSDLADLAETYAGNSSRMLEH